MVEPRGIPTASQTGPARNTGTGPIAAWIIGGGCVALAGLLVVALIAVVGLRALAGDGRGADDHPAEAEELVAEYLDAVVAGDLETALTIGPPAGASHRPGTSFLEQIEYSAVPGRLADYEIERVSRWRDGPYRVQVRAEYESGSRGASTFSVSPWEQEDGTTMLRMDPVYTAFLAARVESLEATLVVDGIEVPAPQSGRDAWREVLLPGEYSVRFEVLGGLFTTPEATVTVADFEDTGAKEVGLGALEPTPEGEQVVEETVAQEILDCLNGVDLACAQRDDLEAGTWSDPQLGAFTLSGDDQTGELSIAFDDPVTVTRTPETGDAEQVEMTVECVLETTSADELVADCVM